LSDRLFSIVVACHNHEDFVRESVGSALSQKHPGKEVIVVDDGSRDRSVEILKTYGDSILLASLPVNRGAGAARNHGASLARGEYIVYLDGDDVLMPWALDVYSRVIAERRPKILMAQSAKCYGKGPAPETTALPREIQLADYPYFLDKDRPWVFNTSSLIVERATLQSAGGWSEDIFYQDIQDLLNKLGVAGRTILLLSPETVWYRMHASNAIRNVGLFAEGIQTLKTKTKAGVYPGGKECQGKRASWIGGLIYYWAKQSIRSGLYRYGFTLLASGMWLIVLGTVRRGAAWIKGRVPVETIPME
jgi:glycosyltransferase involved in cell wall biosynthesis